MVEEKALKEFLQSGQDWEKVETDIPGVFIVKVPGTKTRGGRLSIEINPVDKVTKQPKKRKGLFVADFEMYLQFREAMEDDRVANVIKVLDKINPAMSSSEKKKIEL